MRNASYLQEDSYVSMTLVWTWPVLTWPGPELDNYTYISIQIFKYYVQSFIVNL